MISLEALRIFMDLVTNRVTKIIQEEMQNGLNDKLIYCGRGGQRSRSDALTPQLCSYKLRAKGF